MSQDKTYFREYRRRYRKLHPNHNAMSLRRLRKRRPNYFKERRARYPERYRDALLRHRHGITLVEWNRMFEKQGGCCYICGRHQSECKRVLCVDHDHLTGRIRALLCDHCNRKLGWYERHTDKILEVLYIGKGVSPSTS